VSNLPGSGFPLRVLYERALLQGVRKELPLIVLFLNAPPPLPTRAYYALAGTVVWPFDPHPMTPPLVVSASEW
jgi:hypothetical protein